MTWLSATADYPDSLKSRGLSPATVCIRLTWLSHFEQFCWRRHLAGPADVLPGHVLAYKNTLRPRYALSTQAMALASVRSFFRWAVRGGRLLVDPTADLVVPRVRVFSTVRLSPEQVTSLLARPVGASPVALRNWALLETLYGTGIRLGECHALDLLDANLRDGTLWVRYGKGGQGRVVPIGPYLAQVLGTYLQLGRRALVGAAGEPSLFVARGGGRLSRAAMVSVLVAAGRRIGLPRLGAHALRRACATHTLVAGADIGSVQQLLGHATPDTTQGYASLDWAQVKAEHARTHPRATIATPPV